MLSMAGLLASSTKVELCVCVTITNIDDVVNTCPSIGTSFGAVLDMVTDR